jgi:hypothetical protein
VPVINPVITTFALDRTIVHRKSHCISLAERYHLDARLHARPLLGQHKFPSREIPLGLREQNGNLYGKHVFTIEILVETIEIGWSVLEKQRRWLLLSGFMAARDELCMLLRVSHMDAQELVPTVGDRFEARI